ncbi:MAG: histidine--tRNA ligase, partial [bacterium]
PGAKLFYMGSMFRYERPQAGRYREFLQIGAEYFGTDRPEADAEIVSLAWDLLEAAGLKGPRVELASLGCAADRETYRGALEAFLAGWGPGGLCEDCERRKTRNPLRILDCKVDGERLKAAPSIESHLCEACRRHFDDVRGCLDEMEIPAVLNWRLVRGLDYYTRTVFEIRAPAPATPGTVGPAQDALAAGGRYDALVAEMGGPPIPGVGMALGVDRVIEALTLRLVDLPIGVEKAVFLASAGQVSRGLVLSILRELRHSRLSADIVYEEKSLKSQMGLADKLKAKYVVILGEMEVRKGVATIRDMRTKEQKEVSLREVAPWLVKRLR